MIGVAFVAGTYVLTDTTFAAFDEIFSDSLKGTDVVITAHDAVKQESGEEPSFSASRPRTGQEGSGRARSPSGAIFTPGGFFDAEGRQDRLQVRPQVHLLAPARRASSR